MGERGDYTREHILDPVMKARIAGRGLRTALDVGCGEGRFCRWMRGAGIAPIGIDPTPALLAQARHRDPMGDYRQACAEDLPFADAQFDLVVSHLTLIDVPALAPAIAEMARVLKPGGALLIANLTSFSTSAPLGWFQSGKDETMTTHPVDHYLDERAEWQEWDGIRVENWHRPLATYMRLLLAHNLRLMFFDEPAATSGPADKAALVRRRPWAMVMEWRRD